MRTQPPRSRKPFDLGQDHDEARKVSDREHLRARKRRATLKPATVREIAQSMLEIGHTTPILVRRDGERFVLVHGLHRLEACKALGEESIFGYLVQALRR